LLSCVAAAILLLPLRSLSHAVPPVAFVATLVLFAAPGILVSYWLLGDDLSGIARLPVGFAISTGVFGLLGVPALVLHLSTDAYLLTASVLLSAFLALAAWRSLRPKSRAVDPSGGDAPCGPPAGWLWVPFGLLSGVLAFVGIRRVPSNYDDAWVYLSWVRDFSDSKRLALRDPYFGEKVAEFSRVKVNGWLLEQAALSRVSGLDTIELVLRYLTPTLVVVALLMVYALANTLLKSERAAVITATIYALFHVVFIQPSVHNVGVELAARISEDKYAARFLILPAILLFAVLFIENRRWRDLGLFTFFCWTAVAVHPSVLPAVGLCMLGFGVAHVVANLRLRSAWTGIAALALGLWSVVLGPVLLIFAGVSPAPVLFSADINATPPKVLEYTVFITESWRHIYTLDDGLYIMHPWLLMNPVVLGACVFGVPFLLWRARKSVAAQLLLGGLAVVTVAVYVPQVATFIGNRLIVPGLLWRLAWPIPLLVLVTVGWMIWDALGYAALRLRGTGVDRRGAVRALPLALVILLTAAVAPPSVGKAVGLYRKYDIARTSEYHPDPIHPWIGDNIKKPGVLFARDSVNNTIPAYSTTLNVVSQRGEGMIRDRDRLEKLAGSRIDIPQRYLDVHDFFFGPTLGGEAYTILRRYRADYLMVYAGSPLDVRLKTLPGFSPVQAAPKEKYSLYRVGLKNLGKPATGSDRPQETAPLPPEPS
jgi:hypothetical protein